MTNSYISMKQIWADYDTTVELKISVFVADTFRNGSANFVNTVYTNVEQITQMLDKLSVFYDQKDPTLEIELGEPGKEWANGFAKFGLSKTTKGLVCITVYQQSDFGPTANSTIAHEAKMYLVCEPCSIDNFVKDYRKARGSNMCADVLPVGIVKDYYISPDHNLTGEIIWECRESFDVIELQHNFLDIS